MIGYTVGIVERTGNKIEKRERGERFRLALKICIYLRMR